MSLCRKDRSLFGSVCLLVLDKILFTDIILNGKIWTREYLSSALCKHFFFGILKLSGLTRYSKSKKKFCDVQDNCWCIDCGVYLLSLSSVISLLEKKSKLGQMKLHCQQWFWGQTVPWTITETFVCFPTVIAATVWKSLQRVFEPKITICVLAELYATIKLRVIHPKTQAA